MSIGSKGKHILLQCVGWVLLVVGLAALVLPGPGLLAIFAGMAVLATQHEWAERRLHAVREAATRGATEGVKTWPRIWLSALGALLLVALGVYWGLGPAAPSWWPMADRWWLMGGWGFGVSLIGSGLIALALLIYSYVRFRPRRGTNA